MKLLRWLRLERSNKNDDKDFERLVRLSERERAKVNATLRAIEAGLPVVRRRT